MIPAIAFPIETATPVVLMPPGPTVIEPTTMLSAVVSPTFPVCP
jgi:hypothetical protein